MVAPCDGAGGRPARAEGVHSLRFAGRIVDSSMRASRGTAGRVPHEGPGRVALPTAASYGAGA